MLNYNKRNLTILSIILALIVSLLFHFIFNSIKNLKKDDEKSILILKTSQLTPNIYNGTEESSTYTFENISLNQYKQGNWKIIIPKINLEAPILEGTNKEILRRGVGHFETTPKWEGNICLAAHNRGYKYNYFQEIKNLEIGDVIIYQTEKGKKTYSVNRKTKIKETDLSYIENTNENFITLFTCVENLPEYRYCVQAKEIKV